MDDALQQEMNPTNCCGKKEYEKRNEETKMWRNFFFKINRIFNKRATHHCARFSEHPFDEANILGKIFFSWMFPFIWNGWRFGLKSNSDIPLGPSSDESCHRVGEQLDVNWRKEIEACNWRLNGLNPDRKSSIDDRQYQQKRPSLIKAVIRTHLKSLLINSLLAIVAEVICKSLSAVSVGQMLFYMNTQPRAVSSQNELDTGVVSTRTSTVVTNSWPLDPLTFWTLTLVLVSFCWVLTAHYYGFQMLRIGLQLRVGCSYLIYNKSLKLGQFQSNQITLGRMINLLSNDLDKFNHVCIMIPFLWVGPLQTLVSLCLLWPQLGPSCLGSVMILIILTPIQFYLSKQFARFRHKIAACTDKRVQLMNESISSIKTIKLYGWELPIRAKLLESRDKETDLINRVALFKGFSAALMYVASKMVLFVTILFHCLVFQQTLDAQTLFMSMAVLNNVQFTMTQLMPRVVSLGSESLVSLNRIADFLLQREFAPSNKLWTLDWSQITGGTRRLKKCLIEQQQQKNRDTKSNCLSSTTEQLICCLNEDSGMSKSFDSSLVQQRDKISRLIPSRWIDQLAEKKSKPFVHCQMIGAHWPSSSAPITLDGINFRCQAPELVLICGQMASGKSSLLMALLNELPISRGIAQVSGRLSYASQSAWIFNGTIRDNITFSCDNSNNSPTFNEQRYRRVIDACALISDLELFEHADLTYVQAESLSGGQKARINLARCLYRECDIYLLDDPLAALDMRVADHIFQRAIVDFLADKLVLLLSNQVRYLNKCDKILVLDQGKQLAFGTRDRLCNMIEAPIGDYFTQNQYNSLMFLSDSFKLKKDTPPNELECGLKVIDNKFELAKAQDLSIGKSIMEDKTTLNNANDGPQQEENDKSHMGGLRLWWRYHSENSALRLSLMIFAYLTTQTIFSTIDVYLTIWSMSEQNRAQIIEITSANQLVMEQFRHKSFITGNATITTTTNGGDSAKIDYDRRQNVALVWSQLDADTLLYATADSGSGILVDQARTSNSSISSSSSPMDTNQLDNNKSESVNDDYLIIESRAALNVKTIYRPLYSLVSDLDARQHAIIYALLLIVLFVSSSFTNILALLNCNHSARQLYRKLLDNALFAQMSFYDRNPIGRFLNRATRDFGIIDEAIPYNAQQAYDALLHTTATFVLITLIDFRLAPPSLAILFVMVVFHSIQIRPTRDIQRLEGIARSPILNHIANTLNGLQTIRASKSETRLVNQFAIHQDAHSSVFMLKIGCNRYTAVVLDLFNAAYIAIVALTVCLSIGGDDGSGVGGDGPAAGLAITSAILLAGLTQHGVMKLTETESLMTSVERVLEYLQLPLEAGKQKADGRDNMPTSRRKQPSLVPLAPPPSWPSHGRVEFKNVDLYYNYTSFDRNIEPKKPILKNLSFQVEAGEKIGIIGRTGAGKSSLVSALFRLHPIEGNIVIDGLDINTIGLNYLRSSLGILPQDPVLFASATIRENLDPFNQFPDDELIWSALDKANLLELIRSLPGQLNFRLDDPGNKQNQSNFSFSCGQKQLICLARVLLRKNKIIVLDEATANVDPTTDLIIQATIKQHFKNCTLFTIAHRLDTILDYDRIMILEAGQIVDFNTPTELAKKHQFNSYFTK